MTEGEATSVTRRTRSDSPHRLPQAVKRRQRRLRSERRFRWLGLGAIGLGVACVAMLFISVVVGGHSAFRQTAVQLQVELSPEVLGVLRLDDESFVEADFDNAIKAALAREFPEATSRRDRKSLNSLVSSGASIQLHNLLRRQPELFGQTISVWLTADDDVDMLLKGNIDRALPESERRLSDQQIAWVDSWRKADRVQLKFNSTLFTAGDSREPELAGLRGAIMGSFYSLLITLLLSFPLGVATAVYLEEFAPRKNRWMDLIEININNLAAVPSIVFGLLGLAVFINLCGLGRSTPVVAGLVLTLMTLPTVIIASRAAIRAVPPSIREAALGVGASRMQAVFHHVLPLAMPGMLTGAIIGMAQALGETAPLLMIGMVAFLVDVPEGFADPATALPVQIFLWSDSPERAFAERTSAAIIVLLTFLMLMNLIAVILRRRFERRW